MFWMVLASAKAGRGSKNVHCLLLLSKAHTLIKLSRLVNSSKACATGIGGWGVGAGCVTTGSWSTVKLNSAVIPPAVAEMVWTPGANKGTMMDETNFPSLSVYWVGPSKTEMPSTLAPETTE